MKYMETFHRIVASLAIGELFAMYGVTVFASVTGHPSPGSHAWWAFGATWATASFTLFRWHRLRNVLVS